jgi:hypothetical protein
MGGAVIEKAIISKLSAASVLILKKKQPKPTTDTKPKPGYSLQPNNPRQQTRATYEPF